MSFILLFHWGNFVVKKKPHEVFPRWNIISGFVDPLFVLVVNFKKYSSVLRDRIVGRSLPSLFLSHAKVSFIIFL